MALHPAQPADRDVTYFIDLLGDEGIEAALVTSAEDADAINPNRLPHLAILDISRMRGHEIRDCVERCGGLKLPILCLVSVEQVADLDISLEINDFIVKPPNEDEFVTRVQRILKLTTSVQSDDAMRVGDLTINPTTYEVMLKGKRVNLRFKEYELLRLLATNPGRVYTREALLNQIWGYDYFGGTRTVDVHIRRLRSKIEDADHSFIETIWNVGYRFMDIQDTT